MKNLGKEDDESVINLSTNVSISENVNEDKVLIRKQNLNRII